jgi:hypothetical protein
MFSPISPTPPSGTIERVGPFGPSGDDRAGLSVTGRVLLGFSAAGYDDGSSAYYILFTKNRQPSTGAVEDSLPVAEEWGTVTAGREVGGGVGAKDMILRQNDHGGVLGLVHGSAVTSLAGDQREGDLIVANAAVFTPVNLKHGILRCALFYGEDVRMADLAPVPHGMFLMREYDRGYPGDICFDRKIFLRRYRCPLHRDAFDKIDRINESSVFRRFPIDTVAKRFFLGILAANTLKSFSFMTFLFCE